VTLDHALKGLNLTFIIQEFTNNPKENKEISIAFLLNA